MLFINGVMANSPGAQTLSEPLDNGSTTPALRATEHIGGNDRTVQFLPDLAAKRNFGPVTVPADHYFFLGDNRDNSADSRFIGFVPRKLLIGRAHHILVSAAIKDNWVPRLERLGQRLQ